MSCLSSYVKEYRKASSEKEETDKIQRGFGPSWYDVGQGSGHVHLSMFVDDNNDIMVLGSTMR